MFIEMSSYLRSIDVYDHPISTSFSNSDGDQAVQASSALDFTMTHNYGSSDIAGITAQYVRFALISYVSYFFVSEYFELVDQVVSIAGLFSQALLSCCSKSNFTMC